MISFLSAVCLIISAVVILLAVHFFILPVRISGRLRSCESDFFLLGIRWGFLRVSVKISVSGIATLNLYSFRIKEFPLTGKEIPSGDKGEEEEGFDTGMICLVIDRMAIVFREICFDYLKMNARIGLGDPCDTGIIFGLASALQGVIHSYDRFELNILPVFETEALEFDIEGGIRIGNPFRVLISVFRIFHNSRKKPAKSSGGSAATV